jgi:alpha-beta hydrolase superfamily lysophospholipase
MSQRPPQEHTMRLRDGTELFYRSWTPLKPSHRAVILFHRGHEHSARWQDLIDRIGLDDFWFFAWDARGHGRSPGDRGYAESFGQYVKDADEFVRHVATEQGISLENVAVIAQSVGAVIASTWVHDFAPPIRALVVATPAFRIKLYVPFAIPGLRLLRKFKPKSFIKSYVKPKLLTHDKEQARIYADDKLISPQIAVNILLDLHDTSTRIVADAGAIQVPTLLLISGTDWVVKAAPQWNFFKGLSSVPKKVEVYPEFFHSTLWEKEREQPIAEARRFIEREFADNTPLPSLLEADQFGYTKEKYTWLQLRLSPLSSRWWYFLVQKFLLATGGRLSQGIRVGWKRGFDSGESLDHVYRNTPEGTTAVGRWIDRLYIDSPGWKGIRTRKIHLQQLLDRAIAELSARNEPVRLLDIAAGPGRYVLDTIKNHPDVEISATLCDRDLSGLEAGRKLAASMGITSVHYQESNAFDGDAIAAIEPHPNLAIMSGLYELFPENAPVCNSLDGLGRAIPQNGFLIYTNQPWHPQHEMIARVLPNRDGEPWVMRCRSQAEMDQLVAAAGFRKLDMLIDYAGIFSVSLAIKDQS